MAQITVVGILGKDPEIKFFQDFSICNFPLAYTPREKKNNEWVDGETVWFKVGVGGKEAENTVERFAKGDRVVVVGKLKVSSYTDKDGNQKQGLEIRAESIGLIPKVNKAKTSPSQRQESGDDFAW